MEDKQNLNVEEQPEQSNNEYIDAIKKLKESTVSKEDYEKLQSEKKKLLDSLINGGDCDIAKQDEPVDKEELKKILRNPDTNNLTYVKTALALRKAIIDDGGADPFLPIGSQVNVTEEDVRCADRVASVFQECVDYADGDSDIFTSELQRRTVDIKFR